MIPYIFKNLRLDRILWRRKATRQDSQSPNFNTGRCLYYGRGDIRNSDHR